MWKATVPAFGPGWLQEPICARLLMTSGSNWDAARTWRHFAGLASANSNLTEAHTLVALEAATTSDGLEEMFIHPRRLLPQFPSVTANEEMAARIRNGRAVNLPELSSARQVKVFTGQRELLAIATRVAGTLFHAKIVLAGEPAAQLAGSNRT